MSLTWMMAALVAIMSLPQQTKSEYCSSHMYTDCVYECHCAVNNECSGGICPSGCDTAPLDWKWQGPGCQIGNVGLGKLANMTTLGDEHQTAYPATAALDGRIPPRNEFDATCAHPRDGITQSKPAEWWADLGGYYEIKEIIVYGKGDDPALDLRLQQFQVTVYNTSNREIPCAYQYDPVTTYKSLLCTSPIIGRYVHMRRIGGAAIHAFPLCELVIIGHKVYDCSMCPEGVACDDVIGCHACNASYQPECTPGCRPGSYGVNCDMKCSDLHCKGGSCDVTSGHCTDGCQTGYTGRMCTEQTEQPGVNVTPRQPGVNVTPRQPEVNVTPRQPGCRPGSYGVNCDMKCSDLHCKGGSCFVTSGHCTDGCQTGYTGRMCTEGCGTNCEPEQTQQPAHGNCSSCSCVVPWALFGVVFASNIALVIVIVVQRRRGNIGTSQKHGGVRRMVPAVTRRHAPMSVPTQVSDRAEYVDMSLYDGKQGIKPATNVGINPPAVVERPDLMAERVKPAVKTEHTYEDMYEEGQGQVYQNHGMTGPYDSVTSKVNDRIDNYTAS